MWYKVKELYDSGLSKSQIRYETGLDRKTIRRYLSMNEQGFHSWIARRSHLPKKLGSYYQFVKKSLEDQPFLSSPQIEDRIRASFRDMPDVHSKTIHNFVKHNRAHHGLAKSPEKAPRSYEKLAELSYGTQAQADFGEAVMRSTLEAHFSHKVYFMAIVLSRSRQKFVYFQGYPFTTATAIYAHELAFEYFQGIPLEILYDQDRVFIHDENLGDVLLTDGFRAFTEQHPFEAVFCRKAAHESKGKIENVVKYVKNNFLKGRFFKSVQLL